MDNHFRELKQGEVRMDRRVILIVEDEMLIAYSLQKTLESWKFKVLPLVQSGEEAIISCAANHPDLVIMDINLKGRMDGINAAKRIMSAHKTPIIYVTAYNDPKLISRALETHPAGFLQKPITDRQLRSTIYQLNFN